MKSIIFSKFKAHTQKFHLDLLGLSRNDSHIELPTILVAIEQIKTGKCMVSIHNIPSVTKNRPKSFVMKMSFNIYQFGFQNLPQGWFQSVCCLKSKPH